MNMPRKYQIDIVFNQQRFHAAVNLVNFACGGENVLQGVMSLIYGDGDRSTDCNHPPNHCAESSPGPEEQELTMMNFAGP
jgi:hypothetical protein